MADTFQGVDIFGTGAYKIILNGEVVSKKRSGFVGVDGVQSLTMGGRGWPLQIMGILKDTTRNNVDALVEDIEEAIRDWGEGTLIGHDGAAYFNIELDSIRLTSPFMATADGKVIVRYVITGRKLY